MDLTGFVGPAALGPAYQYMLENDVHAPGSVDRVLTARMVRLCSKTSTYLYNAFTPLEVRYQTGSRPQLEAILQRMSRQSLPEGIVNFTSHLGDDTTEDPDTLLFGGTEEEIVRRGTDWCTDVARVACILSQMAGFPARMVKLFDPDQAYSGHVIIEVYYSDTWGAMDSSTEIVYAHRDGKPASVWELMNDEKLVEAHSQDSRAFYTNPRQFRAAGIANYYSWEHRNYDYTVSQINAYYRSILEMSRRNWPGGLRWLHEEDSKGA